jgi:hypothetical protein
VSTPPTRCTLEEAVFHVRHDQADLVHVRSQHDAAWRAFGAGHARDQIAERIHARFCGLARGRTIGNECADELFGSPLRAGRRVNCSELLKDLGDPSFVHAA